MTSLDQTVAATIQYARFFDYDLSLTDLHQRLISPHIISKKQLKDFINQAPQLKKHIHSQLTPKRQKRTKISQKKLKVAQRLTSFIKHIPTINLIAATGSIAVNNARPQDDIDILIVTTPHTLWITRPFVFIITKLFFSRRRPQKTAITSNDICNNLWLDSLGLSVPEPKRNLYTAHEILQVRPLFDRHNTHQQLLSQNSWVKKHLSNAYQSFNKKQSKNKASPFTYLLAPLNLLLFTLQYLYMKPKLTQETITLHSAYFHPRPLYPKIASQLTKQTQKLQNTTNSD